MDRRQFLRRVGALGCTAAASPLLAPVAFAAGPWDTRLVVIILRGAMDGLDVVRPVGDPGFARLGRTLGGDPSPFGTDFFQFHPALAPLAPLWRQGQVGAVHAVSTPYRGTRSHFDGQDILEAGGGAGDGIPRDGWLNRMLQQVPGATADTAYAIGQDNMLILQGAAAISRWSPDARLALSPQVRRLLDLVLHDDPLLQAVSAEAIAIADSLKGEAAETAALTEAMEGDPMMAAVAGGAHVKLAEFAVTRLLGEARIASFSISGWDTHQNQNAHLPGMLGRLSDTILTLRAGLGPVWDKTAVLCMTEFGRTARENGTKGTDHGTGGALLYAGGALRGGQVTGRWPGLSEADLLDRRDLMPTGDVRAIAADVLRGAFGLSESALTQAVFPGLQFDAGPSLVL